MFSARSPARTRLYGPAVVPDVRLSAAGPRPSAGSREAPRTQRPPADPETCTHKHTGGHGLCCFGVFGVWEQSEENLGLSRVKTTEMLFNKLVIQYIITMTHCAENYSFHRWITASSGPDTVPFLLFNSLIFSSATISCC